MKNEETLKQLDSLKDQIALREYGSKYKALSLQGRVSLTDTIAIEFANLQLQGIHRKRDNEHFLTIKPIDHA